LSGGTGDANARQQCNAWASMVVGIVTVAIGFIVGYLRNVKQFSIPSF